MDRTYRSIPTHPWASNPHQPHFWPCPTPTAPINSAPSSQWCAIFTSRCDSPRGWCVVHCTSTEPIRYKDQYNTQQIILPSRIEEAEKKKETYHGNHRMVLLGRTLRCDHVHETLHVQSARLHYYHFGMIHHNPEKGKDNIPQP